MVARDGLDRQEWLDIQVLSMDKYPGSSTDAAPPELCRLPPPLHPQFIIFWQLLTFAIARDCVF